MKTLKVHLKNETIDELKEIPVRTIKELKIPEWAETVKVFVHPRIDSVTMEPRTDKNRPWTVSEYKTGISIINWADNSKSAILNAERILSRVGEVEYIKTVNHYIEKYGIANP